MRTILAAAFAAMLALFCAPVAAQTYNITLSGASPGGFWTMLGVGIDNAVKASHPGSTVTYQTSGGGFANIALLDAGRVELGLAHDAELTIAMAGGEPFAKPVDGVRIISTLYTWAPMQWAMTKSFADKYGIKSLDDIAVKKPPLRIAVNRRGNISEHAAMTMLKAMGVTADDIRKWGGAVIYAASDEQGSLMRDRRADLITMPTFVPFNLILQVAQAVDVVMLGASEEVINKSAQELGVRPFVIPANTYDFQPEPVPTIALGAALVTGKHVDEQTAYNLTKALHENRPTLQAVHRQLEALTPEVMAGFTGVPYHEGAERYWREVGVLQ